MYGITSVHYVFLLQDDSLHIKMLINYHSEHVQYIVLLKAPCFSVAVVGSECVSPCECQAN